MMKYFFKLILKIKIDPLERLYVEESLFLDACIIELPAIIVLSRLMNRYESPDFIPRAVLDLLIALLCVYMYDPRRFSRLLCMPSSFWVAGRSIDALPPSAANITTLPRTLFVR